MRLAMATIFDPLTFRNGLTAPNRIVLAPMTNQQSHADGTLSDEEFSWLLSRAKGGFGTVMTCAAHVTKDGQGWHGELGIFDDAQLPGLTRLASALRAEGTASFVQIFHGGVRADMTASGVQPWSAVDGEGARAATEEDLQSVIRAFGDAAARAEKAGFDGVEIHGAHGYLLTQFLSRDNVRTDAWGGSLENRARLMREVTREVRKRTRGTVIVRISPEDFATARNLDLDENVQVAKWLGEDGIDGLHLSLWRSGLNTKTRPDTHAIPLFKAVLPADVKIIVAGSIWTRDEANALLALGADGLALGRSAILNPEWPRLVREDGYTPDRPPVSVEFLQSRGLSPRFAEYMRAWKNFVT